MLSLSSGFLLAILRFLNGYSKHIKSLCMGLFCKKKLNSSGSLLENGKSEFQDIEKKILENVK